MVMARDSATSLGMTSPGSARALACCFRRLAEKRPSMRNKSSRWRGAIASTRGRVRSPELLYSRQLLHVDPLQPFLEILRLLVLRLDGEDVALGDHQPKCAVFPFVLKRLEAGH